jgi:hypothetical protein
MVAYHVDPLNGVRMATSGAGKNRRVPRDVPVRLASRVL